ncbi:hypothetical protein ACSDR0_37690 [Streptosporangium sp. G11]|uniref:hypothetical protein n=1 Tax=Streptosporangium sp. G11 TaxID=3436926 RepID=UPI003EB8D09D
MLGTRGASRPWVSPEANCRIRRKPTTDATPERAAVERRFIAMLDAPATLLARCRRWSPAGVLLFTAEV